MPSAEPLRPESSNIETQVQSAVPEGSLSVQNWGCPKPCRVGDRDVGCAETEVTSAPLALVGDRLSAHVSQAMSGDVSLDASKQPDPAEAVFKHDPDSYGDIKPALEILAQLIVDAKCEDDRSSQQLQDKIHATNKLVKDLHVKAQELRLEAWVDDKLSCTLKTSVGVDCLKLSLRDAEADAAAVRAEDERDDAEISRLEQALAQRREAKACRATRLQQLLAEVERLRAELAAAEESAREAEGRCVQAIERAWDVVHGGLTATALKRELSCSSDLDGGRPLAIMPPPSLRPVDPRLAHTATKPTPTAPLLALTASTPEPSPPAAADAPSDCAKHAAAAAAPPPAPAAADAPPRRAPPPGIVLKQSAAEAGAGSPPRTAAPPAAAPAPARQPSNKVAPGTLSHVTALELGLIDEATFEATTSGNPLLCPTCRAPLMRRRGENGEFGRWECTPGHIAVSCPGLKKLHRKMPEAARQYRAVLSAKLSARQVSNKRKRDDGE